MVQKNAVLLPEKEFISSSDISLQKRELLFVLFVAAVAFLVYANSLSNGFVWDDNSIIVSNPALKGTFLSLFNGVDSIRELGSTPYYRPLALMSFMIDNRIHGFNPFLMHFSNVLLHSLNSILIYALARTILKESYSALLVGVLFAVHPISTEAVNFLSARNVLLSTAAILISYLLHAQSVRQNKMFLAISGALFFKAGLFFKETALMILPFIVALEYASLKSEADGTKLKAAGRLMPYVAGLLCYLLMRNAVLANADVHIDVISGLGKRLLDNIFIIPHYLLTVVWPPSLSNRYFVPDDLNLYVLPLSISWICIVGGLAWLLTRGRTPATLFGLCWLFIFWVPTSGLVFFPSAPMADRFFYMPVIGLWIILADQSGRFIASAGALYKYQMVFILLILLALSTSTVARNLDWRSDVRLFSKYVVQYPEVAGGHYNLGSAYMEKEHNLDLAEKSFERALSLDPTFPKLQTNMGFARLQRGDYEGALRHYAEALKLKPDDVEALLNSGVALEKLMRYEEAIKFYRLFLTIPGNDFAEARLSTEMKIQILSNWMTVSGVNPPVKK